MNLGREKQIIPWLGIGFVWPLAAVGACLNRPRLKDLMTMLTAVIRDVLWGWSAVAERERVLQLHREREGCCGRRLFMRAPEERGAQDSFLNLTSIFVLPPNLNQQNIGYTVPWRPAVFFLPPQTCSAVCSNVISIKHQHVDREQLRLKSRFVFL